MGVKASVLAEASTRNAQQFFVHLPQRDQNNTTINDRFFRTNPNRHTYATRKMQIQHHSVVDRQPQQQTHQAVDFVVAFFRFEPLGALLYFVKQT